VALNFHDLSFYERVQREIYYIELYFSFFASDEKFNNILCKRELSHEINFDISIVFAFLVHSL
jgi:hypothetical protein